MTSDAIPQASGRSVRRSFTIPADQASVLDHHRPAAAPGLD
jgi:hypothetical protein